MRKIALAVVTLAALSGCKGPDDVYDPLLTMMLDRAALARARECEATREDLDNLKAAGPWDVPIEGKEFLRKCKVVAKGTKDGAAPKVRGLSLPVRFGSQCDDLKEAWPKTLAEFQQRLELKNKLSCGPDGKPLAKADASGELHARPRVYVAAAELIGQRRDTVDVGKCYKNWKEKALADRKQQAKLRCDVMNAEASLPNMKSALLMDRLAIGMSELDPEREVLGPLEADLTKAEDAKAREAFQQKIEFEKIRMLATAKEKWCAGSDKVLTEHQLRASDLAVATCAGGLGRAVTQATSGVEGAEGGMSDALQKQLKAAEDARQAAEKEKRAAARKACTDRCATFKGFAKMSCESACATEAPP